MGCKPYFLSMHLYRIHHHSSLIVV